MMDEKSTEIRALAFIIHTIRPSWPTRLVEESLAKSSKPFDLLADDAIDAARNQDLRSPAVLATHRRPDRPLGDGMQPPPIERCQTCHRIKDYDHHCKPSGRPTWWSRAKELNEKYAASIRAARAVGDYRTARDLEHKQRTELAKVMAHG